MIPGSPSPGYGFYDDFLFTITGATADSITSTINVKDILSITNLQVRLYDASGQTKLPVLKGPIGGAIDAWSIAISGGGTTEEIQVLPATVLTAGTYVLEVRGDVNGTAGGSYAGLLNLAPVPLPACLPLLLSGLGALGTALRRRVRA
jgi:hypothetical protein